jgi:curli biogenesis system outer membrane secretion channel CsgG
VVAGPGGDLKVVERSNLKEVLSEQELTDLGIVRKDPNAAQRGQTTGARSIVLGTVTSYDSNVESKNSGSNFGLLSFGTKQQQVETKDDVAIDIRVVDSTTGEVVGRRTVEGRASNSAEAKEQGVSQVLTGAVGTLNFGSNNAQTQRTPAAKAIRAALIDPSSYVSCLLVPRDNCMASFEVQDQQRRQRIGGTLKLE